MLVAVHLNLSDRQVINRLLTRTRKGDLASARVMREIRRRFELREAQKEIEKLGRTDLLEKVQDVCDELYKQIDERDDLTAEQKQWFANNLYVDDGAMLLTLEDLAETPDRKFTIDDAYLKWLTEQLQEHDWSRMMLKDGHDVNVEIPPSFIEAVAELDDALSDKALVE